MIKPFMPKAIAIWLIENTALTFNQIAEFCQIHIIEVEALANEENHKSLKGLSPILTGETSNEEIKRCELDPEAKLTYFESEIYNNYSRKVKKNANKESRFKRKAKPEGILWVLNHYPEITNYQISKLLNTTSNTVKSIRSKSYWNYKNLSAKNPVTIGICKEEDLSKLIQLAKKEQEDLSKTDSVDLNSMAL